MKFLLFNFLIFVFNFNLAAFQSSEGTETCTKQAIDLALIFVENGSINNETFEAMRNFTIAMINRV